MLRCATVKHRIVPGLLFASCFAATACERGMREAEYDLVFESEVPAGALLYGGGRMRSTVRRNREEKSEAELRVGKEEYLADLVDSLTLRFRTPCGLSEPVPVTLLGVPGKDEEKKQREQQSLFDVRAQVDEGVSWPEAAQFWIDDAPSSSLSVTVGDAKFTAGYSPEGIILFDPDCKSSHVVTIGGQEAGRINASDDPHAYLLAYKADNCYLEGEGDVVVVDGHRRPVLRPPGGGALRALRGKHLHHLRAAPDSFLGSAGGDGPIHVVERAQSVTADGLPIEQWCADASNEDSRDGDGE